VTVATSRRLETSGGRLAVLDVGEGPPVVLLHGYPLSSSVWRRFVPLLAGAFRVIAFDLIGAGDSDASPDAPLDLDDPEFVTPGDMPARINEQRRRHGLKPLPEGSAAAPAYANLIFHSLAYRYGGVLREIEHLTAKRPERICVVGGGNRNEYLNTLTEAATGLPVERCAAESSTLGNFAIQWARLDHGADGVSTAEVAGKARELIEVPIVS